MLETWVYLAAIVTSLFEPFLGPFLRALEFITVRVEQSALAFAVAVMLMLGIPFALRKRGRDNPC